MNTAAHKPIIGLLGSTVDVENESGQIETVTVTEFRVRDYGLAGSNRDEKELIELCTKNDCGKVPVGWTDTLTPDSYERLAVVMRKVNERFFSWCAREFRAQMEMYSPEMAAKIAQALSTNSSISAP